LAIYHQSIKIISRGKGQSAVAAAAYRAGEEITSEYDGLTHDYTRKGGVVHTEILLPDNAPEDYQDRATLWNAVEMVEKNRNAQLAREVEIALPAELTREQNIELARGYARDNFVSAGMCADVCVHDKGDGNPHAHIMLTVRLMDEHGEWTDKQRKEYILGADGAKIYDPIKRQYRCRTVKTTDWNDRGKAEQWRAAWADAVNKELERCGKEGRIDHRSYERQGKERIPTVHLGAAASQMERKGIVTDRGNRNREAEVTNWELRRLKARIVKLQDWLEKETRNDAKQRVEKPDSDTLAGIMANRLANPLPPGLRGRMGGDKAAQDVMDFLNENSITTMPELMKHVRVMYAQQDSLREKLKPIERRMNTLEKHIKQAETYMEHRPLYEQYKNLGPRKQKKFHEANRAGLTLYEAAERYLKPVLNGHPVPLKSWKEEYSKLLTTRDGLSRKYSALKGKVGNVERIKHYAENFMREVARAKPQVEIKPRSRGRER